MFQAPVGIVGFTGYSGRELITLLSRHPHVEPVLLEHREASDRPRPMGHEGPRRMPCTADSVRSGGLAAVFFATPPSVSMELAGPMLDAGAKVIDLSGAFRLGTPENYQRWYNEPHTQPELLEEAVYGLPEFCRSRVAGARLISNPGCYPTAANLALKPLLEAGVIAARAGHRLRRQKRRQRRGTQASLKTSFCEVTENFSAYSILDHRHVPEVLRTSGLEEARVQLHRAADSHRPRHSRNHLFPRAARRSARPRILLDIYRQALRRRAVRAALSRRPGARSTRRRAHQLLRYRRAGSIRIPAAPWWFRRSIIWARARPDRPSRT